MWALNKCHFLFILSLNKLKIVNFVFNILSQLKCVEFAYILFCLGENNNIV